MSEYLQKRWKCDYCGRDVKRGECRKASERNRCCAAEAILMHSLKCWNPIERTSGNMSKTIREICLEWPANGTPVLAIIAALEARERERDADFECYKQKQEATINVLRRNILDGQQQREAEKQTAIAQAMAAERERVEVVLECYCVLSYVAKDIIKAIYPPPEPAKLPAGHYAVRNTEYDRTYVITLDEPFVPCKYEEYRPITNPFDDQSTEVTGKAKPPLPTVEEWCIGQGEPLCNWNKPTWAWWSDGGTHGRSLPKDVFDAIDARPEIHAGWRAKNLHDNKQARDALKAALLKLGVVRA